MAGLFVSGSRFGSACPAAGMKSCGESTVARLRADGAELVGEMSSTRTGTDSATYGACGHHRRAGRGTLPARSPPSGTHFAAILTAGFTALRGRNIF